MRNHRWILLLLSLLLLLAAGCGSGKQVQSPGLEERRYPPGGLLRGRAGLRGSRPEGRSGGSRG